MSEKRKIAMFQSSSTPVPEENLKKAEAAVAEARAYDPCILVFPECFMCYFEKKQTIPEKSEIVKKTHGMFLARMQELAKEAGFWIMFGCYEPAEDPKELRCYNTVYVLDEKGAVVTKYRKTHLYDAFTAKESDFVIPGDKLCDVLDTPVGKAAVLTCYEARFPEIARNLTLKGANVLFHPTAWVGGKVKEAQYDAVLRTRAIENTVYVISADQCDKVHSGGSMIIDPMGVPVAKAAEYETLVVGEIDLDRVPEVRKILPLLENRRPELF